MGGKIYSRHILLVLCWVFFQCELIAPAIVKELAKGLDPLKTCETLKLCTNGTRGTSLVTKYSLFDFLIKNIIYTSTYSRERVRPIVQFFNENIQYMIY